MDSPKLHRTEAKISGQRNRVQPELRRLIVAIHMHMGRLVWLMAVIIDAVWPHHQYGWHAFQYLTAVRRIPDALLSCQFAAGRSGGCRDEAKHHFPLYCATRQDLSCRAVVSGQFPDGRTFTPEHFLGVEHNRVSGLKESIDVNLFASPASRRVRTLLLLTP